MVITLRHTLVTGKKVELILRLHLARLIIIKFKTALALLWVRVYIRIKVAPLSVLSHLWVRV